MSESVLRKDGAVFITDPKTNKLKYIAHIHEVEDHKVWTKKAHENHVMRTGHFAVDKEAFDAYMGDGDVFRVVTDDKEYFVSARKVFDCRSKDYGWGEQYFVPISAFSTLSRTNVKMLNKLVTRGTFDL